MVYEYFRLACGTRPEQPHSKKPPQRPSGDEKLEREVRRRKSNAKKLWRVKGCSDGELSYAKAVRLQQQLNVASQAAETNRAEIEQQQAFGKDPHRFAANLFQPKSTDTPTFRRADSERILHVNLLGRNTRHPVFSAARAHPSAATVETV